MSVNLVAPITTDCLSISKYGNKERLEMQRMVQAQGADVCKQNSVRREVTHCVAGYQGYQVLERSNLLGVLKILQVRVNKGDITNLRHNKKQKRSFNRASSSFSQRHVIATICIC